MIFSQEGRKSFREVDYLVADMTVIIHSIFP